MSAFLRSLNRQAALRGLAAMAVVGAGTLLGSGNLRHYDPMLLVYSFGVLFSSFALAYRLSLWLQRPPTALYRRRGLSLLFAPPGVLRNLLFLGKTLAGTFGAQRFISRRSRPRWFSHMCLSWGTLIAVAITFPLVFGWMHFETLPGDPRIYRVFAFGMAAAEFPVDSILAWLSFNLLNISAVLVIAGASLALRRRLQEPGLLARQQFGNDLIPLVLLIAVSATGLLLTFSARALHGYGFTALSLIHAASVTVTLLYIPYGKLFHIFQRPLHLAVLLYRRAGAAGLQARCAVCREAYDSAIHVKDVESALGQSGHQWPEGGRADGFARTCPRCRRRLLAFSHGLGTAGT